MISLELGDVVPIEGFELAWRWTDPKHAVLPGPVLADIRPLSNKKALTFADEALRRALPRPVSEWDFSISAERDDPESVRRRLSELFIRRDCEVIVSWNRELAILTTWGTFIRYWDEFCYPSSDDVTVWSPDAPWALVYRHFRVMEFSHHIDAA
jgi:hypothetical protein